MSCPCARRSDELWDNGDINKNNGFCTGRDLETIEEGLGANGHWQIRTEPR